MEKVMEFRRHELPRLREEIKRVADEGRSLGARARASTGLDRHRLKVEKSGVGKAARVLLLAYGLLRGIPYRAMEGRTRDPVSLHLLDAVVNAAGAHAPEGWSLPDEAVAGWATAEELPEGRQAAQ